MHMMVHCTAQISNLFFKADAIGATDAMGPIGKVHNTAGAAVYCKLYCKIHSTTTAVKYFKLL